MEVALSIAPVFALIALGYLAVRLDYVPAASMRPIGDFVLRIALPALIFRAVGTVPLSQALNAPFVGAYLAGSLGAFGLGWLVMRRGFGVAPAAASILALGMSLSNSGFVGYPIVLSVTGPVAATLLAQCMLVENVVMIPLAPALAEGSRGGWRVALPAAARGDVRNPIVVSVLAGLAFSASGLPLPEGRGRAVGVDGGHGGPGGALRHRRHGGLAAARGGLPPGGRDRRGQARGPPAPRPGRAHGRSRRGRDGAGGRHALRRGVDAQHLPAPERAGGLELVAATSLLAAVVLSFGTLSLAIALLA